VDTDTNFEQNQEPYSNKSAVKTVLMKMMISDGTFCYYFADRKKRIENFYHRILIKRSMPVKTEMKFHTAWQERLQKTETRSRLSQKKSP